jgi:hypothetical protein
MSTLAWFVVFWLLLQVPLGVAIGKLIKRRVS